VCHRYAGPSYNDGCFAGWYDEAANVLGDPKTWDQAVDVCHNEGMELCAAPLSDGICLSTGGCMYNRLYQWSTTECEPGDANYQEGCETPTAAPATTGYVMDDSSIRTAVAAWIDDRTAAEASYGHISAWDTSRVRDMGHLFSEYWGWSEFNEDISAWDTSSVTTFTYMFYYASSFNQPISGWSVDKATSMTDMFRKASAFDQDLGWCLGDHVNFASAFEKTKCQSTQCGVSQKDVIGNCERFARPCLIGTKRQCHINSPTLAFLLANILLALLASAEWYVHRRKEEDETYVAAARRLLCCRRCQSKIESSSVTSPRPDSPAESPRDEPDEEATAEKTEVEESVEPSSFSKKFTSFLFGEREEAPTEEAPKEEEEAAALPVFAETEEEATEQPPPPPARRWFSSAEPEPAAPKAEATYSRMKDWYNAPEAAALSATWGAFPAPDEFQTWPGFVAVTNAFLDREAG
jgi:surface protein